MTDRETVVAFMAGYLHAWESNDSDDLRAVFTDDVAYRFQPFEEPTAGVGDLIERWLAGRDEPGDFTFRWELVALDGAVAAIQGRTDYGAGPAAGRSYANLWIVRFGPDGRAAAFTEWWMEAPPAG